MDLCLKFDGLFFDGHGPDHVHRVPGFPVVPVTLNVPFFCCPELASRSPLKRTRMNTAGSTSGDTRTS